MIWKLVAFITLPLCDFYGERNGGSKYSPQVFLSILLHRIFRKSQALYSHILLPISLSLCLTHFRSAFQSNRRTSEALHWRRIRPFGRPGFSRGMCSSCSGIVLIPFSTHSHSHSHSVNSLSHFNRAEQSGAGSLRVLRFHLFGRTRFR